MKASGDTGEIKAIEYLKSKGYVVIDTNFRFGKIGEIDIIGKKGNKIIFFEVKLRYGNSHGFAVESLNKNKKIKILKTIEYYCTINRVSFDNIQFDFIAIQDGILEHFENVELY